MMTTTNSTPEDTNTPSKKRRSNWQFWLMVFLFALPNMAIIYYHYSGDRPDFGHTNKGLLISPMVTPNPNTFELLDGTSFDLMQKISGKWALVMVSSSDCQIDCQKTIYHMRQMRRALSIDRSRVERVLILTDTSLSENFDTLLQDYPLMNIVSGPSGEVQSLVQQLTTLSFKPVASVPTQGTIYLIDPKGRLILAYPEGTEPKDLLKDLRRLLKVSQIG